MPSPEGPGHVPLQQKGRKRRPMGLLPSDEFVLGKQQAGWTRGRWCEVKRESKVYRIDTLGAWAGRLGALRSQNLFRAADGLSSRPVRSEAMAGHLGKKGPCQPLSRGSCEVSVVWGTERPWKGQTCHRCEASSPHL